jgi:hypothetical protein
LPAKGLTEKPVFPDRINFHFSIFRLPALFNRKYFTKFPNNVTLLSKQHLTKFFRVSEDLQKKSFEMHYPATDIVF